MAGLLGNVEEINSSDSGSQQRLVGISPCGVHEKTSFVLANSLGKRLGALFKDDASPTLLARLADVDLFTCGSENFGGDDFALELGLANLALDRATVDSDISEICQQFLGTVLATYEVKQLRGIVDEGCPAISINKGWVSQKRSQEGNVGLDTSDTELDKSSQHLSSGNLIGTSLGSTLDQHGVVVRSDDSSSKAVTTIETNTVTTGRSVDLNLSGIWSEALGRIFGSDTALNGKATSGNSVLGKTKLSQSSASGDLNLGGDNVDASDLFGNGVLDLNTRVDLDKVVAVLLINQKLGSACIAVVDRLGQLDSIVQDGVSDFLREVLGRSNLDDLLVSALDRAVTLIQVDNVAVVVTEQLDLDMLGLVEEALYEDGAVAKGRLGLGSCSLEVFLQALVVANNSHTTTTAAISSLDDDREAILISEGLNLFVFFYSSLGSRDDRDASSNGKLASRDLVAKSIDHIWGGADKL